MQFDFCLKKKHQPSLLKKTVGAKVFWSAPNLTDEVRKLRRTL